MIFILITKHQFMSIIQRTERFYSISKWDFHDFSIFLGPMERIDILRPKINIQTHTSQFSIGCLDVNCVNEAEIRQRK